MASNLSKFSGFNRKRYTERCTKRQSGAYTQPMYSSGSLNVIVPPGSLSCLEASSPICMKFHHRPGFQSKVTDRRNAICNYEEQTSISNPADAGPAHASKQAVASVPRNALQLGRFCPAQTRICLHSHNLVHCFHAP